MKSLRKAKTEMVWCRKSRTGIAGGGSGRRKGNKIVGLLRFGRAGIIPPFVTCPDCKKRFKPYVQECDDLNCWHFYLPAHKKRVKCTTKT